MKSRQTEAAFEREGIVKAYLDSNVVISIVKDDTPAESDSLDRLLVAYEEGKVDLVTSEVTHNEIKTYQGPRQPYERIFRLLNKVPIVRWDELLGINTQVDKHTMINTPMIQNDPIYDKLLALGVETVDAQHVFVAAKSACEVFLTCDKRVLARRDAIKALCGVTVQKPSEFVAGQGW
jgi:predicted nucleic acid-binding protein